MSKNAVSSTVRSYTDFITGYNYKIFLKTEGGGGEGGLV
jgi:hypothetical protein